MVRPKGLSHTPAPAAARLLVALSALCLTATTTATTKTMATARAGSLHWLSFRTGRATRFIRRCVPSPAADGIKSICIRARRPSFDLRRLGVWSARLLVGLPVAHLVCLPASSLLPCVCCPAHSSHGSHQRLRPPTPSPAPGAVLAVGRKLLILSHPTSRPTTLGLASSHPPLNFTLAVPPKRRRPRSSLDTQHPGCSSPTSPNSCSIASSLHPQARCHLHRFPYAHHLPPYAPARQSEPALPTSRLVAERVSCAN